MIINEYNTMVRLKNSIIDKEIYQIEKHREQTTVKINEPQTSYYLHSKYSPKKQAKRFVEDKYTTNKNLVVYGLGLGYHIEALIEMLKPNQTLHIIECNFAIAKIAFEYTSIKNKLKKENIYCYIEDNLHTLSSIFNNIAELEDINLIVYEPSMKTIPKNLEPIKDILQNQIIERKSYSVFEEQLKRNYEINIKQNYTNGVRVLRSQFNNIPCIIVSAGPSLHQNIEKLKEAVGKALIITVGRSFKLLNEKGIVPDIIMETDCQSVIMTHFMDVEINEIPLLFLSTANNSLNYIEGDKLILYEKSFCPTKELEYTLETGGSVATTALSLAIEMGCNPITFIGQDLCYTGSKSHHDSTKEVLKRKTGKYVKGIDGTQYYTTPSLYKFLRWMEEKISRHSNITFLNGTAKGAAIKGTKNINIENWLINLPPCKEEFNAKLEQIVKENTPQEEIKIFTCTITFTE